MKIIKAINKVTLILTIIYIVTSFITILPMLIHILSIPMSLALIITSILEVRYPPR